MLNTTYLATAIGIFALLQGFSRIIRRDSLFALFQELPKNRALSYVVGTVLSIIGVIFVVGHTMFQDWLTSLVTFVGWAILLDGCVYLFLPSKLIEQYLKPLERTLPYYTIAIGYLALGILLIVAVLVG